MYRGAHYGRVLSSIKEGGNMVSKNKYGPYDYEKQAMESTGKCEISGPRV